MDNKILTIPSLDMFNNEWGVLKSFLERRGNPKWECTDNIIANSISIGYITDLCNLVSAEKYFTLQNQKKLIDLGSLEYVGHLFDLFGCTNLTSLGNLTHVGGSLDLSNCKNLKSLGNLKYVGGHLYLRNCGISLSETKIRTIVNVNLSIVR